MHRDTVTQPLPPALRPPTRGTYGEGPACVHRHGRRWSCIQTHEPLDPKHNRVGRLVGQLQRGFPNNRHTLVKRNTGGRQSGPVFIGQDLHPIPTPHTHGTECSAEVNAHAGPRKARAVLVPADAQSGREVEQARAALVQSKGRPRTAPCTSRHALVGNVGNARPSPLACPSRVKGHA
jgi:hypothetical protein